VALFIISPAPDKRINTKKQVNLFVMNWSEFKVKYKQEITVGIIVFIAIMLMRIIKFIINKM
jgi:hypothetical protein